VKGPDEAAKKIHLTPLLSGKKSEDEGLFKVQHQYWVDAMTNALQKDKEQQ
jgi:benzoate/toluate 1,2-dioxygenase alpha subunit